MTFETPLWIPLGFAASLFNAAVPLIQEKFKANGFALAIWVKIILVIISFPVALYMGFPTDPKFYLLIVVSAIIWCVNDVIYFKTVPAVGAGVVSRIIPVSVILAFVIWFLFEPDLLVTYLERPWQAAALFIIVLLAAFFAVAMKSCPVTWQGIKMLWFVVLAAAVGTLIDKLSLGHSAASQAPFAFMFIQGIMMLFFWGLFAIIKKPVSKTVFFSKDAIKGGAAIGTIMTIKLGLSLQALFYCEHPALLSVILFTDALWIILYYRLTGREDHSKIWAGLGLVGCAAALVLVKSL